MRPSKIALLSLGGFVLGAIIVATVVARAALGWGGSAAPDPGEIVSVSADLSGFDSVEIHGLWTVDLTRGDEWQVELSYPENYADRVDASVRGDRLILSGMARRSFFGGSDPRFAAEIVMPVLEGLDVAGSGRLRLSGFEGDRLTIDAAGATRLTGEDGRYGELDLSAAGASDIRLEGFVFTDADVNLAGASRLTLTMDGGELGGSIAGAGRIRYLGTVSREAVQVAGAGSVGRAEP